jgi:hypothetical protein
MSRTDTVVLPTDPGIHGRVGRAGSPLSTPTWSTPSEVTPSTPDHASTSGPTMCPKRSTRQITRRDCRPRWTISPLALNAGRRLPRQHGARRYGDHPCRSDGGSDLRSPTAASRRLHARPHRDPRAGTAAPRGLGCGGRDVANAIGRTRRREPVLIAPTTPSPQVLGLSANAGAGAGVTRR